MELLIVYLIFAAIPAFIAPSRGRRWGVWLLISVLLSPILGLILVLALPSKKVERAEAAEAKDRYPCPRCGEKIARSATVCRFCNTEVTPSAAAVAR